LRKYHRNQGNVDVRPKKDSRESFKHFTMLKKTRGETKGSLMNTFKDRQMSEKLMGNPCGVPKDLSTKY
jgi:hypothetical protein